MPGGCGVGREHGPGTQKRGCQFPLRAGYVSFGGARVVVITVTVVQICGAAAVEKVVVDMPSRGIEIVRGERSADGNPVVFQTGGFYKLVREEEEGFQECHQRFAANGRAVPGVIRRWEGTIVGLALR